MLGGLGLGDLLDLPPFQEGEGLRAPAPVLGVDLAKPNVLRYFESREAVLLELLDQFLQEWLTELAGELAAGIDENLPMAERAAAVA